MQIYLKSIASEYRANSRAFEIPFSGKIPEEMYVFCLSMMADTLDASTIPEIHRTAELKAAIIKILNKRMAMYDTSTEEDEELLQKELRLRERMAVEVRLGEKRILKKAIDRVDAWDIGPPSKRMKTH
jgi:N-lysine methyltransferase SETD6